MTQTLHVCVSPLTVSLPLCTHRLRLRVKSLQQVIDSQAERMASLAADRELAALGHHDESTGQGEGVSVVIGVE